MSVIAIIPARGGSRRIPGKNKKAFKGKPIIVYSIEEAKKTALFDEIYVSTDDSDIAYIAMMNGAKVWERDPAYCDNAVGTQDVVREFLLGIGADDDDLVCCIYATAPLMWCFDITQGHWVVRKHPEVSFAFSVGDKPLQDAGQFYWGRAEAFKLAWPLVSIRSRMIYVDDNRVCDINTMKDWNKALKMYEALRDEK